MGKAPWDTGVSLAGIEPEVHYSNKGCGVVGNPFPMDDRPVHPSELCVGL